MGHCWVFMKQRDDDLRNNDRDNVTLVMFILNHAFTPGETVELKLN